MTEPQDSSLIRPRRYVRWALVALVAAAMAFLGGFVLFSDHIGRMKEPAAVAPADGIVVLTGGYQRIEAALALLKEKRGKRLLISGVHPATKREELRRVTGGDKALFACCVDIDRTSRDTVGNAVESAKWIRANGFHTVILVTSNYHIPRSLVEMRKVAADVVFIPFPVVNGDPGDRSWMTRRAALRVLFGEYVKYLAAVARSFVPGGA